MYILIIFLLNNIARWTFILLIVLEAFFFLFYFLFCDDFWSCLNVLFFAFAFWWLCGKLNVYCFIKVIIFI